jgi:hypothetical protein
MKKIAQNILFLAILWSPMLSSAYSDPKGWFKLKEEIEGNVSNSSQFESTIGFNNKLFNFICYNSGGTNKIVVRKITNQGSIDSPTWKVEKRDDYKPFQFEYMSQVLNQPAPVIFNSKMYLFYYNNNRDLCYSVYDPLKDIDNDTKSEPWSSATILGYSKIPYEFHGMSATVVDGKVCIVGKNQELDNGLLAITWSDDLANWHNMELDYNNGGNNEERFGSVSAITTTVIENGVRKQLLNFGYVDPDHKAKYATYKFGPNNNLQVVAKYLISEDFEYQCVALAEGTVKGDPESQGNCIQAFLKLEDMDDGHGRYRIQRYQFKNNTWAKREDNLVKENYGWANKELNLTVANFGMSVSDSDQSDIRQLMCLIYTSKNGTQYPMNCAYVETDRLVFVEGEDKLLDADSQTHYIGFIEGVPPFKTNDSAFLASEHRNIYRVWDGSDPISVVKFKTETTSTSKEEISVDVSFDTKFKGKNTNAGFSNKFSNKLEMSKTSKIESQIPFEANGENKGMWLLIHPLITRNFYHVEDVTGEVIDSAYFFYVSGLNFEKKPVELQNGLKPSAPATYMNRQGIRLSEYPAIGSFEMDWIPSSPDDHSISLNIDAGVSNTKSVSLMFGAGEENFFDIGFDGSLEFSTKTTTEKGNAVAASVSLNDPRVGESGECTALEYKLYWILPKKQAGTSDWWLPAGAEDQNPWCITYVVTKYETTDKKGKIHTLYDTTSNAGALQFFPYAPELDTEGKTVFNIGSENPVDGKYFVGQNYPNPFNGSTRIRYAIGEENPSGSLTKLIVYDISGHQVATLVNENKAPGSYEVEWDASQFTPGVYFYSLQSGSFKDVKKLVLLK